MRDYFGNDNDRVVKNCNVVALFLYHYMKGGIDISDGVLTINEWLKKKAVDLIPSINPKLLKDDPHFVLTEETLRDNTTTTEVINVDWIDTSQGRSWMADQFREKKWIWSTFFKDKASYQWYQKETDYTNYR